MFITSDPQPIYLLNNLSRHCSNTMNFLSSCGDLEDSAVPMSLIDVSGEKDVVV